MRGSALVLVALAGCRQVAAEPGPPASRVLLTGELVAVEAAKLTVPRTPMWNIGIRWMEKDGTEVKKGQRVLEFDNSAVVADMLEKQLAALKAENEIARQEAQNAQTLADRQFEVEKQKIGVERARLEASVPGDAQPRRVHQEKQLALVRAKVELAKAEDELVAHERGAALEMKVRRIALDKAKREIALARKTIDALSLHAPRDGILLVGDHPWEGRKLQVGDSIWVGLTVLTLPDLGRMEVHAALSDVDDGRVTPGMKVRCTLDAHPDHPVTGTVLRLSPVAQQPERASLRRAFLVQIALDRTDPDRMLPGMSVKVEPL